MWIVCSVWESHHAWKLKETTNKKVVKAYKTIATEGNVFLFISLFIVSVIQLPPKKVARKN